MTTLELFFNNIKDDERCLPYLGNEEKVVYKCDGTEGSIFFDGYYYVEDNPPPYPEDEQITRFSRWLPKTLELYVRRRTTEPYKEEPSEFGGIRQFFNIVEEHAYIVEIYKRTIHENTDKISEIEDEDGEPMSVCFFPTNKQTIYFRVLETLPNSVKIK